MITKFEIFINESLRSKMKGKSDKEIKNLYNDLEPDELLMKSAKNGYLDGVKYALENDADPSTDDNYAIRYASYNGHLDIVKELLKDERVDPSDVDNWSIIYASSNGHLDIVKELLKDERVDPSDMNNYAIRFASYKRKYDVVKELLKDKRVLNKLNKLNVEMLNTYRKLVSNLNESLKDKLKGKSEEEIKNAWNNKVQNLLEDVYKTGYSEVNINFDDEIFYDYLDEYHLYKNYFLYKNKIIEFKTISANGNYIETLEIIEENINEFKEKLINDKKEINIALNKLTI